MRHSHVADISKYRVPWQRKFDAHCVALAAQEFTALRETCSIVIASPKALQRLIRAHYLTIYQCSSKEGARRL